MLSTCEAPLLTSTLCSCGFLLWILLEDVIWSQVSLNTEELESQFNTHKGTEVWAVQGQDLAVSEGDTLGVKQCGAEGCKEL